MSRRYQEPVGVTLRPDGTPATFTWRRKTYHVHEVFATWHLQDRWWDQERQANRYYVRVTTADHMVFDLFADVARKPAVWVLDVVHD